MIYLGPSLAVAWAGSVSNVLGYQGARISEWTVHDLSMNHSFFSLVKTGATVFGHPTAALVTPYLVVGLLLLGVIYWTRLQAMPEINQLLVVSVFVVGFPPTSYFYTLVHLYPVFVMTIFAILRGDADGRYDRGLRGTLQVFVPLFTSFTLFTFRKIGLYGGPIQAVFLVALLVCGLVFEFTSQQPKLVLDEEYPSD